MEGIIGGIEVNVDVGCSALHDHCLIYDTAYLCQSSDVAASWDWIGRVIRGVIVSIVIPIVIPIDVPIAIVISISIIAIIGVSGGLDAGAHRGYIASGTAADTLFAKDIWICLVAGGAGCGIALEA